jgi:hypothetical protein
MRRIRLRQTGWTAAMALAVAFASAVPQASAVSGESITFKMVPSPTATCLGSDAHGRVTVSDLGSVQNMHVEVTGLTPNNEFTLFVVQHNARPFGLSWYQGDIETDSKGNGIGDFTGIFSEESFILNDTTAVPMAHLGIWFADPNDAGAAGCSNLSTPFDGDGVGGILVLSTSNFPDASGPLLHLKEEEVVTRPHH